MKEFVFKIAKGLEVFSLDEISMIAEINDIENILQQLIKEKKVIHLAQGRYKIVQKKKKIRQAPRIARNIVFKTLADRFINQLTCSERTKNDYIRMLKNHINPFMGSSLILSVGKETIEDFSVSIKSKGLSDKSLWNYLTLISGILDYGVKMDLLPKNPVLMIQKPKSKSKAKVLNNMQIKQLLNASQKKYPDFYPFVFTALATGMQRGDLINLTWDDVDFKNQKIIYKGMERRILECKVFDVLFKQKSLTSNVIVFPSKNGTKLNGDNLFNRRLKPLCKSIGIPELRFLDLRHTYVQRMRALSHNIQPCYF